MRVSLLCQVWEPFPKSSTEARWGGLGDTPRAWHSYQSIHSYATALSWDGSPGLIWGGTGVRREAHMNKLGFAQPGQRNSS